MYIQTQPKKYQLLETGMKTPDGIKLYQIKASRSFGDITAGQLGGYVQSKKNLSQYGDSWIYPGATVVQNARVQGNSKVYSGTISENIVIANTNIGGGEENSTIINSKNIFTENSTVTDVSTVNNDEIESENISIKNSTVSGVIFNGSNVKITNSTIIGGENKIRIGNGVVLSGVTFDADRLIIKDDTTIIDTIIVGDGDCTIQSSSMVGCKISTFGFTGTVFDSVDLKDTRIGCGKDTELNGATFTGKTYSSYIGFNGECSSISITFNGAKNNICIGNSSNLTIGNYNNENLYISATGTIINEEAICKGTVKLGTTNTTDLLQLDQIGSKVDGDYFKPDFTSVGEDSNKKISNFTINGKSILNGCTITESSSSTISKGAYISSGTNISKSSNFEIYAKVSGTISKSNYIHIENNACVHSMSNASNARICGNATITNLSGNCNNAIINGDSYISADSLSGGVINNSDLMDLDSGSITNCIVNNSEINTVIASGKVINNSSLNGIEVQYNEYDNRTVGR